MKKLKETPALNSLKFLFAVPLILLSLFFISPAAARSVSANPAAADSTSLKAFEGIYQQKDNQYAYGRIVVVNDTLLVKQVDGDKQFKLRRKSDLGFEMPDDDGDEMIPVVFSKNSAGEIAQVLIGGRQVWVKVKNVVPVTEVKLTAEQLKAFEGKFKYEQKEGTFLQITATPDGLTLKQLWDNREFNFISLGDDTFLNKQQSFPLKFSRDQNGNVIKVLAFNRDMWDKVKE